MSTNDNIIKNIGNVHLFSNRSNNDDIILKAGAGETMILERPVITGSSLAVIDTCSIGKLSINTAVFSGLTTSHMNITGSLNVYNESIHNSTITNLRIVDNLQSNDAYSCVLNGTTTTAIVSLIGANSVLVTVYTDNSAVGGCFPIMFDSTQNTCIYPSAGNMAFYHNSNLLVAKTTNGTTVNATVTYLFLSSFGTV